MIFNIKTELLICIISFLIQSDIAIHIYGCDLNLTTYKPIQNENEELKVLGDTPPPYTINDLTNIKIKLSEQLKDVVESNLLDTMSDFLRFYNYIRKHKQYAEFYMAVQEYNPEFTENSSHYGLVLKMLNNIEENGLSRYTPYLYITTVHRSVTAEDLERAKLSNHIPTEFIHSHVAAVFRYELNGTEGYLLLEPVLGITDVVNIKDDYRYEIGESRDTKIKFRMLELKNSRSSEKYIYGKKKELIYYLTKPFCHFVKLIPKSGIFITLKSLAKRNREGLREVCVWIDINSSSATFVAVKCNPAGHLKEHRKIPFSRLYNNTMKREERILFKAVNDGFGRGRNFLKTELLKYKEMMKDDDFIRNYKQLVKTRGPQSFYF